MLWVTFFEIKKKPGASSVKNTGLDLEIRRRLRLSGRRFFRREGLHFDEVLQRLAEFDFSVAESEKREIPAAADVLARMKTGAALTHDNAARADDFTGVCLDAEHFRLAVATVTAAGLTFFMCHFSSPL